jgi:prevent-host-death family protein
MKKPTLIAAEPVSAYDAKTHLPKLLERAAQGERFVITRHGKPVAQLIPFEGGDSASIHQAVQEVASLRAGLARQGITLASVLETDETARDLAHASHRY